MSCIEVKTKKYQYRKSPPYHAKNCKGEIKIGNDGKKWKSITNNKMIYKWIAMDSKTIKTIKTGNKITGKIYYIHDNGRQPFKVICNESKKTVYIYKDIRDWSGKNVPEEPIYEDLILEFKYKKIFSGELLSSNLGNSKKRYLFEPGNSVLLYLGNCKYVYIGSEIYSFETGKGTDEEITKYYSAIGNNDVPYPFAVSKNKTYLMIEYVILDNQELEDASKECKKKDYNKEYYNKEYFIDPYFIYYNFCDKNNNLNKTLHKLKHKILHKRL